MFLCMIQFSKLLIGKPKELYNIYNPFGFPINYSLFKSLPFSNVKVLKSQKQKGVKHCSLSTIAFPTALAHGQNFSKVKFQQLLTKSKIPPCYLLSERKTCSFSIKITFNYLMHMQLWCTPFLILQIHQWHMIIIWIYMIIINH